VLTSERAEVENERAVFLRAEERANMIRREWSGGERERREGKSISRFLGWI